MDTGRWYTGAIAGLLAFGVASCAHEKRPAAEQPPAPAPRARAEQPPGAAQQSQQAFEQAAKRQEELAQAQKRLEAAHQEVAAARQHLAQAQQREEQERAAVQQLDIRARQDLERASRFAQQAQTAAEQAQGLQSAQGRVAQATPSHVLLQMQDGRMMSFQIDQQTQVLVGSEQRSVSEIQQGADARIAYDPKGPQPTAITIRLTPLGTPPASPARPGDTPSR